MIKFNAFTVAAVILGSIGAAQASPSIEIGAPWPTSHSKVALVFGPEALRRATTQHAAGMSNIVSLDLDVGLFTGIRAAVLPYSDENLTVALEGFFGATLLSPGYGGGVHVQFRVAASQSNALLISPGLDVYFSPPDSSYFGHAGNVVYVLANTDIEWLHEFAEHFGFELGARLGGGLQFSDGKNRVMPEVELFTGVRF